MTRNFETYRAAWEKQECEGYLFEPPDRQTALGRYWRMAGLKGEKALQRQRWCVWVPIMVTFGLVNLVLTLQGYSQPAAARLGLILACVVLAFLWKYLEKKPDEVREKHLSLSVKDQLLKQRSKMDAEIGRHRKATWFYLVAAFGFASAVLPWREPALITALALLVSFALISTGLWLDVRRLRKLTEQTKELDTDLQNMQAELET